MLQLNFLQFNKLAEFASWKKSNYLRELLMELSDLEIVAMEIILLLKLRMLLKLKLQLLLQLMFYRIKKQTSTWM